MTIILILSAIWLLTAPFVLAMSTGAVVSSIVAALVAGVLVPVRTAGPQRAYGALVLGLVLGVVSLAFGAPAVWSGLAAGVLLFLGGAASASIRRTRTPVPRAA